MFFHLSGKEFCQADCRSYKLSGSNLENKDSIWKKRTYFRKRGCFLLDFCVFFFLKKQHFYFILKGAMSERYTLCTRVALVCGPFERTTTALGVWSNEICVIKVNPTDCKSVHLSGHFLWIGLLDFFWNLTKSSMKLWVAEPNVLKIRYIFWILWKRKLFFSGFGLNGKIISVFLHKFHVWFLRSRPKCFRPIKLQDSSSVKFQKIS